MKIRRNLLWASPLWTPVLYMVQALKWSYYLGIYDPLVVLSMSYPLWESHVWSRCQVWSLFKRGQTHAVTFSSVSPSLLLRYVLIYRHCKSLLSLKCSPPAIFSWSMYLMWQDGKDRWTGWQRDCIRYDSLKKSSSERDVCEEERLPCHSCLSRDLRLVTWL